MCPSDPPTDRQAEDWQPESHTDRLRRQAREMDLTARLEWLEAITTFAAELHPRPRPDSDR